MHGTSRPYLRGTVEQALMNAHGGVVFFFLGVGSGGDEFFSLPSKEKKLKWIVFYTLLAIRKKCVTRWFHPLARPSVHKGHLKYPDLLYN